MDTDPFVEIQHGNGITLYLLQVLDANICFCLIGFPMLILRNDVAGSNSWFFNSSWTQFTQEFGSPSSQYWIGLEKLHHETTGTNCTIRFDLKLLNGTWYYAQYSNFTVGDSSTNYRLTIGGFSGNSSDAMAYHNG